MFWVCFIYLHHPDSSFPRKRESRLKEGRAEAQSCQMVSTYAGVGSAKAGIYCGKKMDSRLRGNDEFYMGWVRQAHLAVRRLMILGQNMDKLVSFAW